MAKSQRSQNLTHGLRTYLARQDQGPTAWICARLTDQKHDRTVYGLDLTICATFLQNDLIMHRGSLLCRLSPAFIFATTEHMISNLDTAKKVYGTLLSTIEGLNRGFEDASDKLSESERHSYGRAIGKIVDAITSEALTPLLEAHAHLGTPELFGMRTLQDTDELPDCLTGSLPGLAGHYELAPGEHTEQPDGHEAITPWCELRRDRRDNRAFRADESDELYTARLLLLMPWHRLRSSRSKRIEPSNQI